MKITISLVTNIRVSQNSSTGPHHGCTGPHLIKNCESSVRKPSLEYHVPARCARRKPPTKQQWSNPLYNNSPLRNLPNGHNNSNIHCPYLKVNQTISQNFKKLPKKTRYFKRSCKTHNSNDQVKEITQQT